MRLSYKQTIALDTLEDQTTTELIFGGGAGGGKSILGAYWILKSCLKYPQTRWVIGRNSLKTLKETTLNSLWQVCALQGVKTNIHFKYNAQTNIITFQNGSEIYLKDLGYYPSDPNFDELGSLEITGAFVDECNQITEKAWLVLKSRIRHNLDRYGLIPKILGSCNPSKNWVYMNYFSPFKRGELPAHKKFIQALVTDNPEISKHYRENLLTLDKASKERLLHGNWEYSDDPAVLIEQDAIYDLFTNNHVLPTSKKYISADLAMQGRDKFVCGVWDGFVCNIAIDEGQSTGKSIEESLQKLMIKHSVPRSHTVADSDGLGNYLVSYLEGIKTFHGNGKAYDAEYQNIKAECGYKLAEMVNNRQIRIICNDSQKQAIIEELGVLKRDKVDNDEAKKQIIPKNEMKELINRSPDYLDMLLMRMLFEVKPEPARLTVFRG
jgi:phage terminase large subunit